MGRRMFIRHGQERKLERILVGLDQTTVGAGAQGRRIRQVIIKTLASRMVMATTVVVWELVSVGTNSKSSTSAHLI